MKNLQLQAMINNNYQYLNSLSNNTYLNNFSNVNNFNIVNNMSNNFVTPQMMNIDLLRSLLVKGNTDLNNASSSATRNETNSN